jgi:DNA-directed RNA polymerase specialized sigma24 family protein
LPDAAQEADEAAIDALMARLSGGDRASFDPLFRALYPRALRLARVRLSDSDALDAAQAALVKVFAGASAFTAGRPALPWFYAVAANEVHAVARRRAVEEGRRADEHAADILGGDDDPERALAKEELRAAIGTARRALDPVSASAIAALLGETEPSAVSPAAQRKRLSRAYAKLRTLLGGQDDH